MITFIYIPIPYTLGDCSASLNTHEQEIDKRLNEVLLMEDPHILVDLRELNSNQSDKYSVFWEKCESYLQECTAVHERRHDSATYLAHTISVRDLVEQVSNVLQTHLSLHNSWCVCNFTHEILALRQLFCITSAYLLR